MYDPEVVSILRDLSFWLRFNGIIFPMIAVPLAVFIVHQWYMTKRLHDLHTIDVDKSGFGTNSLTKACKALTAAVEEQTRICESCQASHEG